jgi:hypothetical protein
MRFVVIFFLTGLNFPAFAQGDVEITMAVREDSVKMRNRKVHDSIRHQFVKPYPDHFFVWPVIKKRSLEVEIKSLTDTKHSVFFKPNNSVSMGVGFYVLELVVELTFAVPIDEQSAFKYGKSDASDLQLNVLGKYWGLDLYRQKYDGFYLDDSFVPVAKDQPYIQRPDISTRNFGLAGIYNFNRDKFSFRSSYNFAERQLYSRGSFFFTGTINSFRMEGDSALLSIQNRDEFSTSADFVDLRYTTFGLAPGYSHNFIYRKFFLNLTLGIGPAHNWTYLKREDGTEKNDISINSISVARFGIGYNNDRFFAGIGFVNQSRNLKIEDFRITNSTSMVKLLVGYRFKEFGFLKKRVVDFIPFKI